MELDKLCVILDAGHSKQTPGKKSPDGRIEEWKWNREVRDMVVEAFQDPAGNIVMRKPATPGMENRKGVIMQAHMDLVPQKAPDNDSRNRIRL